MSDLAHIPTPETDTEWNRADLRKYGELALAMREKANDLERRLTVAREALKLVSNNKQDYGPFWHGGEIQQKITEALTLTAPKP